MFTKLKKLQKGDKVAIISPSFAAPAVWQVIYLECLTRLRQIGLEPVEFPFASKLNASFSDRSSDLISAFENPEIKAVIATLGGDDQVMYIKNLPKKPFINNPKPFFGFSDNTHFINHLWICGVPAFYGFSLFTQAGTPRNIDEYTLEYFEKAIFAESRIEVLPSTKYVDQSGTIEGFNWDHGESYLRSELNWEDNSGYLWNVVKEKNTKGILWGGCLESIDELLRHKIELPNIEVFNEVIMYIETSEEVPANDYVKRVLRALGELGYLNNIRGLLVGRPMSTNFVLNKSAEEKIIYRESQFQTIIKTVRNYNSDCIIIGNIDFGHTRPQICIPSGQSCEIDGVNKKIYFNY